ncbi:probable protein phosphatase 2C 14 [Cynara cardunculus var. scolymus]|uniref:probable protein phosphatase 2C 14 n=1 Tax=Cynara cardunculus var. scolymus TaxID=59895 RepID=UPI000D623B58|nr:probable protein phosphatase 2C 14 [Cynara cardunculus var. scolymus]
MPPSILRLSDGDTTVTLQTPFTVLTTSKKRKRPPMIEIPNVLQEIESAAVKFTPKNFESRSDAVFSSSGFGVGVCSVKGRKSFMEDTHTIVSSSNTDKVFFGVYDGHGGSKAAEFVAKNLHSNVLEMLDKCSDNTTTEEVVKAAFIKTDDEFLKQGLGSGTCCVTALIKGKELVVSNLGDCRAVLSRKGKADMLTNDHRASHEDERKRIEDKGGYVELHRGTWRVHGILAVSRSIGDAHLKDWVVGEPETKVLPLTEDLEYLVLASDGLWDEVGNQEAIDVVTRCMLSPKAKKVYRMKRTVKNNRKESENNEPTRPMVKTRTLNQNSNCKLESQTKLIEACRELVNLGVSRGSLDDITVMIVDLKAFQ